MGVDEAAPGGNGSGLLAEAVDSAGPRHGCHHRQGALRHAAHRYRCALITAPFSLIAGLFLGTVTGGLIGLATESGLFRGTRIGAITRALVSIEVVHSSIRLWRSRRSGIWSILHVPRSVDLDQSKVPGESRTAVGRDGEVDRDDVDKLPRDPMILHSEVVMVEDDASHGDEDAVEPEHDGARPEDEYAEYEYEKVVESDEHGEDDDGVTYE
ncbi:hypothetical protein ZWY2020_040367 [Hordeum vulgare]|nr:hypothetical protein ZWY2020_040367 [Hordeum vulgare]